MPKSDALDTFEQLVDEANLPVPDRVHPFWAKMKDKGPATGEDLVIKRALVLVCHMTWRVPSVKTAKRLGIPHRTVQRYLQKSNIDIDRVESLPEVVDNRIQNQIALDNHLHGQAAQIIEDGWSLTHSALKEIKKRLDDPHETIVTKDLVYLIRTLASELRELSKLPESDPAKRRASQTDEKLHTENVQISAKLKGMGLIDGPTGNK